MDSHPRLVWIVRLGLLAGILVAVIGYHTGRSWMFLVGALGQMGFVLAYQATRPLPTTRWDH